MNFYIMTFRIELSLFQMSNRSQHNVGLNFFFTNCINNLPHSWMLCMLLRVVHVRTYHRNFSQILKGSIHLVLKEQDPNLSLFCHLEVDLECALEMNEYVRTKMVVFLHHLVLNYEWSIIDPFEKIIMNPFPTFQKGLQLKIHKKD